MPDKRMTLIRAMMNFGGSKDASKNIEAQVLPDSPMGRVVGMQWDPQRINYLQQKSKIRRKNGQPDFSR